jgi:hypothetical protein
MDGLAILVAPANGSAQRLVIATRHGGELHRDTFDANSAEDRRRFCDAVARLAGVPADELFHRWNTEITQKADEADRQAEQAARQPGPEGQSGRKSQATAALELVRDLGLEFWHTRKQEAWVSIPQDGHTEHWKVRSRAFQAFLRGLFFEKRKKAISSQAVSDAVGMMECWSIHGGPEYPVAMRVGQANGKLYLDLADEQWRAVEVDADGWRVITNPPVRFKRAAGMLPLPEPDPQGRVDLLRELVRLDDAQWALLAGWMLGALHPEGPYPVLVLHGEQGTGKSSTARMIRALLDPSEADTRTSPRDERDLMIAANNGWVVNLDNLSEIAPWLSDALCRLSTGGGFTTRELYTDDSEVLFAAKRPVVLNGIAQVAVRPDLLNRSVLVELATIAEEERRPERDLWRRFHEVRPAILGGLLTAAAQAMARQHTVTPTTLPRMADFAIWVMAGEEALGMRPGEFAAAYGANRTDAVEMAVEASPIGAALLRLLEKAPTWTGTASELLETLAAVASEVERRQPGWPTSATKVGMAVRRLAPALRGLGYVVRNDRKGPGRQRIIELEKRCKKVSMVSQVSAAPENPGEIGGRCGHDADTMAPTADTMAVRTEPVGSKHFMNGADTMDTKKHAQSGCVNDMSEDGEIDIGDLFEHPTNEGEWHDL